MTMFIDFFVKHFSGCVELAVLIAALIPTLENRIAIPLGMNSSLWGDRALSAFSSYMFAFIGSILPCIFIILITKLLKRRVTGFISSSGRLAKKAKKINQKSGLTRYLLLTLFVAIPLPLTGVWSASLIAGLAGLDSGKSFIAISLGAAISCAIVTITCLVFVDFLTYFLICVLILIGVVLLIELIIWAIKKIKGQRKNG